MTNIPIPPLFASGRRLSALLVTTAAVAVAIGLFALGLRELPDGALTLTVPAPERPLENADTPTADQAPLIMPATNSIGVSPVHPMRVAALFNITNHERFRYNVLITTIRGGRIPVWRCRPDPAVMGHCDITLIDYIEMPQPLPPPDGNGFANVQWSVPHIVNGELVVATGDSILLELVPGMLFLDENGRAPERVAAVPVVSQVDRGSQDPTTVPVYRQNFVKP